VFVLDQVERSLVDRDIKRFLRARLADVARRSHTNLADVWAYPYSILPEDWPGQRNIDVLCFRAEGRFSYASAFIKFIGARQHHPPSMLDVILSLQRNDRKIISEADLFELLQRELCKNRNSRDAGTGEERRRRRGQGEGWYLRVPSSAELEVSYTCSVRITGL